MKPPRVFEVRLKRRMADDFCFFVSNQANKYISDLEQEEDIVQESNDDACFLKINLPFDEVKSQLLQYKVAVKTPYTVQRVWIISCLP